MTDGPPDKPRLEVKDRVGGTPNIGVTTGNGTARVVADASQNILTYCETAFERELQNRANQKMKQQAHDNYQRQSNSWHSFLHDYPSEQQGLKNLQTLPPSTFLTPDDRGRYNVIEDLNRQIDHQNDLAFEGAFGFPASPDHVPDQKKIDAAKAKAEELCRQKQAIDDSYKPSTYDRYRPQIAQGVQNFGNALTELGMSRGHPEEPMSSGGGRRGTPAIPHEPEAPTTPSRPTSPGAAPTEPEVPATPSKPSAPSGSGTKPPGGPDEGQTPGGARKPAPAEGGEAPDGKPPDGDAVKRTKKGDPVVVATGEFVEDWEDFRLPGTIEVDGIRRYGHRRGRDGPLGRNRTSAFDVTIEVRGSGLVLFDERGHRVHFERPFNLSASRGIGAPGYRLRAPWLGELELRDGPSVRSFRQGRDGVYRLAAVEDRNGNRMDHVRSAEGVLERVQHSDGFHLRFDNDPRGLRTAVTLVRGDGGERRLVSYAYDAAGNMTASESGTTFGMRYDYDPQGRLRAWRDDTGRSWGRMHFDAYNRVVRTETSGRWNNDTFSYDRERRITTYRPGGGDAFERFGFDVEGRLLWEENALGERHTHAYERGYHVSTTDPLGSLRSWDYDDLGNVVAMVDPEGRRTSLRWGSSGELVLAVEPTGAVWRWDYDERGNVVERVDPMKGTTRYAWTAAGRLASVHHADGTVERRSYDGHHRLVKVVDRAGGRIAIARDGEGRIIAITDPAGATTRYGYGEGGKAPLDFVTRVRRPDGVEMSRTLDDREQVEVDGEGRVTRRIYGPFDRLSQMIDPMGGKTSVEYDVAGRVARVTNPEGATYLFERDLAGRVVAATDFDGRTTRYRHDAAGNLVERLGADGGRVAFTYNRLGQVTESRAFGPDGAAPAEVERFGYDEGGALCSAENAAAHMVFERDLLGRIVGEIANGRRLASSYDALGRRTERRIGGAGARCRYDPLGALVSLEAAGTAVAVERDAAGREVRRSSSGGFSLRQTFDAAGRLCEQVAGARTEGDTVRRTLTWNAEFEPLSSSDSLWGRSTYRYDANGQVREACHGLGAPPRLGDPDRALVRAQGDPLDVERYAYDGARDVSASDVAGPSSPLGRPLTPWATTRGGLVRTARGYGGETIRLTHDPQGRLVERRLERNGFRPKVFTYRWNGYGRLLECRTPDGAHWTYAYDALGRRVSKRCRGAGGRWEGRAFLWDGDALAQDAPIGADGSAAWDRAVTWHGPRSESTPMLREEEGAVQHIVADPLGTPREAWDDRGRLVWAQAYSLWGTVREAWRAGAESGGMAPADERHPTSAAKGSGPDIAIRFPGQWADAENGLHYNRFRFYDPSTTQYASPDPTALEGGFRPQAYVHNPAALVDPLGLDDRGPNQYHSFYDFNLPDNTYFQSDNSQFRLANQGFIQQMNSDPAFRQDMLSRYPGLQGWMDDPKMTGSPDGLTWHHTEDPGKLSLVDRNDHADQHGIYHPTGRGGRAKWGGGEAGRRGRLNSDGTPKVKTQR